MESLKGQSLAEPQGLLLRIARTGSIRTTASSTERINNIDLMQGLKGCDEDVDSVTTCAIDAVTFAHPKSTKNSAFPTSLGEKKNKPTE